MTSAIPTDCAGCAAPLGPHNITRLCAECKLIARNHRLGGQPVDTGDPITYGEALANVTTILGARVLYEVDPNEGKLGVKKSAVGQVKMRSRGKWCFNCGLCGRDHWVPAGDTEGICPKRNTPIIIRVGKK